MKSALIVRFCPFIARAVCHFESASFDAAAMKFRPAAPRHDELALAKEGIDWMMKWKAVHPQFNTVEDGEY